MVSKSLYYGLLICYHAFALWYDQTYIDLSSISRFHEKVDFKFFGGRHKFLTQWNMLLQSFFFTIAFLNELLGSTEESPPPKKTSTIRKLKDLLLPCLAFPLSMFVGLTFWGLYFVDRELVFPKAIDPYFPAWLNHVMHTNIMIFVLLEMYMSFRRYPSRSVGLTILSAFMACYLVWLHVIFFKTGIWVYPVLDKLDFIARMVFFICLLGLSIVLYLIGEKINQRIWLYRVRFEEPVSKDE